MRPIAIRITTSFDGTGAKSAQAAVAALTKAVQAAGRTPVTGQAAQAFAQQTKAAQQAQQAAYQLTLTQQRLATAEQQTARTAAQVARETANAAAAQTRAEKAAVQLAAAQQRAAQAGAALPRTLDGLSGAAANFAKAAGGAFAVDQVVRYGAALVDTANGLEDAKSSLQAISGNTATYAEAMAAAERSQRLFGGSLAENVGELTSFVISSRAAGVSMTSLIDVSQRLATLDPGQGLRGANVALRELMSSNPRSLAMRFELPANTLKALGDESLSASEKLSALSGFLDTVGITSESVNARLENNSQAYRDLGAASDALQASLGGLIAQALAPAARGLAMLGSAAADAIAQLTAIGDGTADAGAAAFEGAAGFAEYAAKIAAANDIIQKHNSEGIGAAIPLLNTLTQAQHTYAQALIAGGKSTEEALAEAASYGMVLVDLGDGVQVTEERSGALAEAQALLAENTRLAGIASRDTAADVDEASAALDTSSLAADAQTQALQKATQAAFEVQNANGTMAEAAQAAAQALYGSGAAGAAAAADLGNSTAPIDQLTAAYYRLLVAMNAVGGGGVAGGGRAGNQRAGGAIDDNETLSPGPRRPTAPPRVPTAPAGPAGGGAPPRAGRGGGGGSSRASEAQQAQEKLAQISADGAQRIEEINAQTAERLVEIDRQAAEERARIAAQLQTTLSQDAAAGAAAREANDLDMVGETDKKRLAQLEAREKAEAEAAQRLAEAQARAREQIANGEAEAADEQYQAAKAAIDQRQQLDQQYYEKQAELAGNPEALAELDAQYQEAVKALDDAAKLEQEIAAAKAAAKVQAAQEERAAVIQAAEEQKAEVVKKAEEQAAGVKGASEAQRNAVVSDLGAQARAATDWATATESAARRVADAYAAAADAAAKLPAPGSGSGTGGGGAGAGTKAAGGGSFISSGPTTLTVGDNPGGVELVTVTPLSGKGSTSVGPGMVRMAGGGSLLAGGSGGAVAGLTAEQARALVAEAQRVADLLSGALVPLSEEQADALDRVYGVVAGAADTLETMRNLGDTLSGYRPPLDLDFARRMAGEARAVAALLSGAVVPSTEEQAEAANRYFELTKGTIDAIAQTADLGRTLTGYRPPINVADVRQIAAEAAAVARQFQGMLLPATAQQVTDVERYGALVGAAVSGLAGTLDLRERLAGAETKTPLSQNLVTFLAQEAQRVAGTFRAVLLPLTEQEVGDIQRYADAVRAGLDGLAGMVELRRSFAEGDMGQPVTQRLVTELAQEAQRVAGTFRAYLLPFSEQEAADTQRYADAVAATASSLSAVAQLRRDMAEPQPPLNLATVQRLAGEARDVTRVVRSALLPLTEAQGDELGRYADAVSASVGVVSDVLSLSSDMFTDYKPPTDAQIQAVARDAVRIARSFATAAAVMNGQGSDAAERLASATTESVTAVRESLLTMQALNDQTFTLDTRKLAQFEASSTQLYTTLDLLGRKAVAIPAANVAAVRSAAEAVTAQAQAFTALASVPFANLPQLAGGFAGGGGGQAAAAVAPVTNYNSITVNAAPGQTPTAIADAVLARLNQTMATRR